MSTLFLGSCVAVAAEGVVVRLSVTPTKAWIGQRVVVQVDVLGKDGWAQITKLGDVDVPGTHLMRTETQGTRIQDTIDGSSYTGQRYAVSLFPQRSGVIEIPRLPLEVTVRSFGVDAEYTVRSVRSPATSFTCRWPRGAEHIPGLISTPELTMQQTWVPDDLDCEVGDAVKRTITFQAEDVSGMVFAPLEHEPLTGLGMYPDEPTVDDATDRGTLAGTRIETVTYVCEQPGEVTIPGVSLSWWNIENEQLERIELPGRTLRVQGARTVDSHAAASLPREQRRLLLWLPLAGLAALIVLAWRLRGRVISWWADWCYARAESEPAYFRRAMNSVRTGGPSAALRDIVRWLDRIHTGRQVARLDVFLGEFGDPAVQSAARHLCQSVAFASPGPDPKTLIRGLSAARADWRRARRAARIASVVLPELNMGTHASDARDGPTQRRFRAPIDVSVRPTFQLPTNPSVGCRGGRPLADPVKEAEPRSAPAS